MTHTAQTSKKLAAFMRGRTASGKPRAAGVARTEGLIQAWTTDSSPEARKAYKASREMRHDTDPAPTSKGAWYPKGNREARA